MLRTVASLFYHQRLTSTDNRPTRSPFTELPGELLNQIYDLALIQDKPIELWSDEAKSDKGVHPKRIMQKSFHPTRRNLAVGLLLTCRKFRDEASSIFYSSNTFYFSGTGGWNGLWRFLAALNPKDRSYIKRLGVFLPMDTDLYILKPCCGPTGDVDSKSSPRSLLEDPGQLVPRCCDLMKNEMSLQQLSFIVPPGIRINILKPMITDDWLATVHGEKTKSLRDVLGLEEDIILLLQPRADMSICPSCLTKQMGERQWVLSKE